MKRYRYKLKNITEINLSKQYLKVMKRELILFMYGKPIQFQLTVSLKKKLITREFRK